MINRRPLETVIADLINRRAEGTYWDFKRCHHNGKYDLIHDVICLANSKHMVARYLIFGVDNEDFSLHSTSTDSRRRTQDKIASLFRDNANKFFQSRFPEFYLQEISIAGNSIDVLVIEDTPNKPYYLVQRLGRVRPYHIYTRVCDTNTPVDDSAQPHEIERMWRERFGLDRPPVERVKLYLDEPEEWFSVAETHPDLHLYYRVFPEFTLKVTEAEGFVDRNQEWTRGEIRTDNNSACYFEIYYHQTCLSRVHYVSFDDHKKSMVAPRWEPIDAGRFYYYQAQSIEYAIQKFNSSREKEDHSTRLSIRGEGDSVKQARALWGHQMKIPVLRPGELRGFLGPHDECKPVKPSCDAAEQYDLFVTSQLEFEKWRANRARI